MATSELPPAVDPRAAIGPEVRLGTGTTVGPFCCFTGRVTVGANCRFAAAVALGGEPMDCKYAGEPTEVRIGDRNVFFEYSTVHRSTGPGTVTSIGDDNMVMTYVHVAHNCRVGSGCVLSSGAQLGGHATVGDRATIGGLTGIHQFCRVGRLAMIGACSYVNKDIPPFMLAAGRPSRVRGINAIGLERAGFAPETVQVIRAAFRLIYRSELNLSQAINRINSDLAAGPGADDVRELVDFLGSSARGIELRTGPEEVE